MKQSILSIFLFILLFPISFSYGNTRNRCMDLYNIHLGYNALTNITEQALGLKPDLQYCNIIYKHFPDNNEPFKLAARFIMDFAVRVNHPPLDSIVNFSSNQHGQFLSWLTICSRFAGDIQNRKYFKKLKQETQYEFIYFQTIVWSYPIRWDANMENPEDFIKDLDQVLAKQTALSESETVFYNLFKLELEFESTKNESVFLEKLDLLFTKYRKYLSVSNYHAYLKKYFPKKAVSTNALKLPNDSYDINQKNSNPLYASYCNSYNSLRESINAIEQNPFNKEVFSYPNTNRWLKKENYSSIIKSLEELNRLESVYTKVCNIPALSFDFIKIVVESKGLQLNRSQYEELKIRLLKKWVHFHIACNITTAFYMDKNIIAYWDSLSKENQTILFSYFEKEFERTDNSKYFTEMKKVLKQK